LADPKSAVIYPRIPTAAHWQGVFGMRTERPQKPPVKRGAYSIDEWCAYRRVSRSQYYKLQATGRGPKVIRNGIRTIITDEADQAWRIANEEAGA
jgi:hypothetical protein